MQKVTFFGDRFFAVIFHFWRQIASTQGCADKNPAAFGG
jgi:hypothetical protein